MSQVEYEIHADEAWTHNGNPLKRYWCFIGGLFGSVGDLDRLDKQLRLLKLDHGIESEVKWSKITVDRLPGYTAFIDCVFDFLWKHEIRYRQIFLDRSYVHYDNYQKDPKNLYNLDVQFKVYYQLIKHHFGIKSMPSHRDGAKIYLRLDDFSSQKHKDRLEGFVNDLPQRLERPDIQFAISYVNSARNLRIQICDLLMGAAGSYGNKMHDERSKGRRGMSEKQKIRLKLCKHIYDHLRKLSCGERGTHAFNWFESTGASSPEDGYKNKVRIWKFIPKAYLKDKGWENDHLGKAGLYIRPAIDQSKVFKKAPGARNWEPISPVTLRPESVTDFD